MQARRGGENSSKASAESANQGGREGESRCQRYRIFSDKDLGRCPRQVLISRRWRYTYPARVPHRQNADATIFRKKIRTPACLHCPTKQVKAIRAAARFLVFVVSPCVRCPNLFFAIADELQDCQSFASMVFIGAAYGK